MNKLFIKDQKKLVISTLSCHRSIEIGDSAIDNGFLLQFPGATLAIFLYLITHIDNDYTISTNPTLIASYLPDNYTVEEIHAGLTYLKNHGIIDYTEKRDGDYTYLIQINISSLCKYSEQSKSQKVSNSPDSKRSKLKNVYFNKQELRDKILEIPHPSRAELFQGILTFIPPEEDINLLEANINQWLEDFDEKMVKELIRRVDKWQINYNNPPERSFHYLKGIIDDWYKKGISTYQELQYHDKLYREIREIAQLYGLSEWQNISPVQLETFNNWLQEDYPLSIELVKLAIEEAFKRKKDGQPSLQYIENNFIKPLKKDQVRDCQQARRIFNKNSSTKRKTIYQKKKRNEMECSWDKLAWDFED